MPLRNVSPDRSRGAPTANKHKGHQQTKNRVAYATHRRNNVPQKNRDRRAIRILKGFRPHVEGMNASDYKRAVRRHPDPFVRHSIHA